MLWFSGLRVGATPVAVSPVPAGENRLADIVRQQVEPVIGRHGPVGLVVGAIAGDREVLLGFGSRRMGDSAPPDADTRFEIGSITKVFTGILLARRIERGELQLDTRIVDLLPGGWELSAAARETTLRHCTTHCSGLPRLPENLIGFSGAINSLFGGDPYRDYSEQAFREALATTQVKFQPGARCLYSNFAVGLLGFVLATHGETDYELAASLLTLDLLMIADAEFLSSQIPPVTLTRWRSTSSRHSTRSLNGTSPKPVID